MYDFQLKTGPKNGACISAIAPTLINISIKGVIAGASVKREIMFELGAENPEFHEAVCERLEKDCWNGCNKTQGQCNWCGRGGWCCRQGFSYLVD